MIELNVNGKAHACRSAADTPLLYVLREELQLHGAKFGCGLGQCGSCTVLVDEVATLACVTPILLLQGRQITTVESLGSAAQPGPLQRAFLDEQAAQCGFCIAGMMMRAQELLLRNRQPTDAQMRAQLQPNLCRCGTHLRILRAVRRAATLMLGGDASASQQVLSHPEDPPEHANAERGVDTLRQPLLREQRERPDR